MAVTKVTTKVLADDAVTIDKIADAALVTETEGISSNDNDTTIPTSAAVKDYVDTQDATKEDAITGAATTITGSDLTASKALISNASGKVAASTVTDTELSYVSGVSSSIQDQFDNLTDNDTTYTIAAADGDNADEEKIVLTGSDASTDEVVLEAGTGLSIARSGDKITFTNTITDTDTVLTTEQVEDIVGAMVSSNNETGITVTYDDTNGKIDFAVSTQTDENFTSALKTKLEGISSGAEVNQNAFSTIAVSGQTSVNSDSNTDTLNLAAGTGITLTTDAGTDTVTITSTATGSANDAFKTISVAGQNDVVADGATDTLTLAAGSNITLTTDAATDTITIASTASGGGGGGSVNVVTTQYTGDGSTQGFALDSTPGDNDAVQVYLNGVYQVKDAANYSISGSTLTFVTPPTNSTAIELVHFISEAATSLDSVQKTGDGTTATFDLGYTITDEKYTFVFIQGVYQEKSTYTTSGSSITFSTPPQNGYTIEVMVFGTSSISEGGGISWDTTVKTAAFTAVASKGYFVNTTSAAITVTLPGSPSAGDELTIVDYAGTADTNNITITSSDNINGASDDVLINYERGGVSMVYVDATQGWIAYNAANETDKTLVLPAYDIESLLVAGGGGGGYQDGGGGGGGGFLTSTISSIQVGETLSITVGGGGAGGTKTPAAVNNGSDTIISYTSTTIRSIGGGGGASDNNSILAGDGGSGGGGAGGGGTATGGSGTSGQGNDGGDGGAPSNTGGGGGGAGAVGQDANGSGANGGVGATTTIISTANATTSSIGEVDSSNLYFSGGGGGDNRTVFGSGGLGGGTNAAQNPIDANANTGGGGGSTFNGSPVRGANGGSGVVILKMPTTSYSGNTTGSPDEYEEGSNTVLVFKSTGSYTT